ncbi:MAG: M20/M25/M40 family metallo-hydrolase, partial [Luteolibacter sp.]
MNAALEDLFSFLRFPSISTDSGHTRDVRMCADWLVGKLTGMGLATELHETARHPIVVARNRHHAGRRTVMIYGHYDVQPVDPLSLWQSDPFQPEIRDGRIWARGATDNKGQMLAHVLGVESMLCNQGELPVN